MNFQESKLNINCSEMIKNHKHLVFLYLIMGLKLISGMMF